jgi:hypothetical protein
MLHRLLLEGRAMKRTWLRRVAVLLAGVLLFAQLAIAAYACPMDTAAAGDTAVDAAVPMPDCSDPMGSMDPASPNLCAEHCKQGQQCDRASFDVTVSPALLNPLYETPAVPEPTPAPPQARAWLSALVAASPPHAIAHCVLRI